jgi:hypothetical protein
MCRGIFQRGRQQPGSRSRHRRAHGRPSGAVIRVVAALFGNQVRSFPTALRRFRFMGGLTPTDARRFNPIAPTLLTLAVKRVMTLANVRLLPSALDSIVEGAGGDVRSAIMTLEFSCARPTASRKQSGKNR